MDIIPKNEGEIFIEFEEEPGYYLSNQERLFNLKLTIFHKKQLNKNQELFQIHKHKYYIRHLMNKYFNDIQVDKLIPITKYGSYEFENYYFDKENQKVYLKIIYMKKLNLILIIINFLLKIKMVIELHLISKN